MNHIIKILLFTFILPVGLFSQGNLLVTPTRVSFEGNKTREDLNISNIGKDTAVYVISFLKYRMNENGSFTELDRNDQSIQFADEYIRIFPRRVTLPPNESQTIRLQYRRPSDMKPGELRSHLYFRAEKETAPLGMDEATNDSVKMSVRITPIFGISIPVIVRHGDLLLNMNISDVNLNMNDVSTGTLSMFLNREGNRSAYGNIKVVFQPTHGKEVEIALANGVGVYTEIARRHFTFRIQLNEGVKLSNGKLIITYTTPFEDGNKLLARSEFNLE